MATYEHLLETYDVRIAFDDIASANPPAFMRRVLERDHPQDPHAAAELEQLARSLGET